MKNIKESLKILARTAKHRTIINNFARSKYIERFSDLQRPPGTYHNYSGYDVISETKLKVNYNCGAGEMDFNEYFYVEFE